MQKKLRRKDVADFADWPLEKGTRLSVMVNSLGQPLEELYILYGTVKPS